ncbi:MupA/Atu3671 family FMN-dependent luciferase-like monooxygenase [Limimaricola hongkongensis]|uniref:Long-chain-fatty-acid--CoA ligase n=1 Tax=Limimaricola hongkongensis DSM 17492 TaxID=1122180 RepID=A0A017HC78_9RHOB|nr:MupA/Atu3671 family FMN-dependent luciferase-like monooxygenase [Limimaricola hongkongensis]EYD72072.1 Long-chain-fatty-acid--CoA ligase [Limimaricola hongkongensis DSM 17492]
MSDSIALVGSTALSLETARMAQEAGLRLALVVSRYAPLCAFAAEQGIALHDPDRLDTLPDGIDWLISAGNLDILPGAALARFASGAINFHDGPLPERAGRNAPVWALLDGACRHAVTWHLMTAGVDAGDILVRRDFDIAPDDTAQSLNARCFAAALETLPELFEQMRHGLRRRPQCAIMGHRHRAADRPRADALIDGRGPAEAALRLVRALDHGAHPNPLCCPKIAHAGGLLLIGAAQRSATDPQPEPPGTVRAVAGDALELVFEDGVLRLSGLRGLDGAPPVLPAPGTRLPPIHDAAGLTARMASVARAEPAWRARLEELRPAALPGLVARPAPRNLPEERRILDLPGSPALRAAAWAVLAARLCDGAVDVALGLPGAEDPHVSGWVPLRLAPTPEETLARIAARLQPEIDAARAEGGFAADLPVRIGVVPPVLALGPGRPRGARLGFDPETATLWAEGGALLPGALDLLAGRLTALMGAGADTPSAALPALPPDEAALLIETWNATEGPVPGGTIHAAIAAQAGADPDGTALIFNEERLSHAALEARANRMARVLRDMGAGPGTRVGLYLNRSAEMVVALLAVLKTGAAYLPLDPGYPAERIALYLDDSAAGIVITEAGLAATLPPGPAQVLRLDDARLARASDAPLGELAAGDDLAYLIYTSGSTGRPKGVMIEHRHVLNFFEGMDERVPHGPGDALLAVTSISFDISVLELFWSLSRGVTLVIQGDAERMITSSGPVAPTAATAGAGPSLSLFYWGHEESDTGDYALLLDGARFADAHGFEAVWTPERHFHGFGAAYPNPAVTGAAVAAVTSRVAIRAGSCVAPLHHPARIAEDWAVIDRLSGGRAGLALAAGWQPQDFVLRPEAAPPANRAALGAAVQAVRKLWRGEPVAFADANGEMHEVLTRPRPVSAELPLWITIAGNPQSWREAGLMGANVLTHLLGQSVEDLGRRIIEWRAALAEAGHDPATRRVTVMLHAYLDESRDAARAAARGPMTDYLRSAAGLIARHAAAFPAFRRGANGAVDPAALTPEEEAAVLDHAFERYFEEQGLFGTIEDGRARCAQLHAIGVDEIACLIDFGLAPERVMEGLPRLAELVTSSSRETAPPARDRSIAAQIRRHGITHMQCTPSMARMLVADEVSRAALGRLRHMLVGGEALPAALAGELRDAGVGHLENMYGPTETTVWSASATIGPGVQPPVIGRPIRNTRTYVLDADMCPCPVGQEGELWIGGAGVARGYWNRGDLTEERFRPDPFVAGARIYRTGDLARWRADGMLDFIGRADGQVKLRGHRIELGEVEAALDAISRHGPSVAVLREDRPGDLRLVAYLETTAPIDEAALRRALGARLPAIMVPARIVTLERFPLTPNRKTDRAAMPAPLAQARRADPPVAPRPAPAPAPRRGEAMAAVAAIWRELLGVEELAPGDSFFDLGGHSLLAVRAHREIRDRIGVPGLKITDIFGLPRLGDLVARIETEIAPAGTEAPAPVPAQGTREEMMARRRQLRARRLGHV